MLANLPWGFSQSTAPFDRIDSLAADVIACIRKRGDSFGNDAELESWLDQDGVGYSSRELRDALEQAETAGLLSRPHKNRDWPSDPLPGYLITPRWDRGY